jgi:hypothetical protein
MNANNNRLPLMTVDKFEALQKPKGNFIYELHFGTLVKVVCWFSLKWRDGVRR